MSCLNPYSLQTVAQETDKQRSSLLERDDSAIPISSIENKFKTPILMQEAREKGILGKWFTLKGGQEIQFYEEDSLVKAKVEERLGFLSRSFVLPIYFESGSFAKSIETSEIHILSSSQCRNQRYVYIGKLGLADGMKEGKQAEVSRDKEEMEAPTAKKRDREIPSLGDFAILPISLLLK